MKIHEKYMRRCIQLAKNGLGSTYPNPLVGSVIVFKDKIIGEGWHYKSGMPHAEVNAIGSLKNQDLLKNATIYISLEPCNHFGKTSPCVDLIIEKEIKKVVIGNVDPNPKVAGKGIKKLMHSGCEVTVGILERECAELNKRFFTFHLKNRPFIILKWAQSKDGFIAPKDEDRKEKSPVWITNEYSRQLVHKMRANEQAILVGKNTVFQDNPSLTTRDYDGKNPIRILIDRNLEIPQHATIFNAEAETIVITEKEKVVNKNIIYEKINFAKNVPQQINEILYDRKIQSLIVEGGFQTLQSFIDVNLWDEAYIFTGKTLLKNGLKSPTFDGITISSDHIKEDILQRYKNPSS